MSVKASLIIKNILSLSGKKSWLVSTNVEMILLFVRLNLSNYHQQQHAFIKLILIPI